PQCPHSWVQCGAFDRLSWKTNDDEAGGSGLSEALLLPLLATAPASNGVDEARIADATTAEDASVTPSEEAIAANRASGSGAEAARA
ncbi:MAG: hypothetical protein AAFW46_11520, partial [Pseudomonadota bacterium]